MEKSNGKKNDGGGEERKRIKEIKRKNKGNWIKERKGNRKGRKRKTMIEKEQ